MLNSRKLEDLLPQTQEKVAAMLKACEQRGLQMLVSSTLRDLEAQAVLFRINRNWAGPKGIGEKVAKFRARGLGFLADVIERVGPQRDQFDAQGKKRVRTNAAPGESWHNYGRAADCYPLVAGKLADDDDGEWRVYGNEARAAGLEWAGGWTSFRELAHVQDVPGSNPLKVFTVEQVREALKDWV